MSPGNTSEPTALWFGVRWRASCIIADVISLEITGIEKVGAGRTWPGQGNATLDRSVGSRDSATVSYRLTTKKNSARVFLPSDGEVDRKGQGVVVLVRCAKTHFKRHPRLLHNRAEEGLAML